MPGNRYLFCGMVCSVDVYSRERKSLIRLSVMAKIKGGKEWIKCMLQSDKVRAEDINRDAQYLGIIPEQLIISYLEKDEYSMNYQTKHRTCDFLQEDRNCKLGDCKPDSCKKYPYTDRRRDYL